jgi:putative ABC transport system ATP-binding protein
LLDAVLGEVAPTAGRIAVYNRDLARLRRSSLLALRRRLGVVPQRLELLPERSAIANVALPLEIDHVPRSEIAVRAALCLGRVGLAAEVDRPVGTLSLAQQQRVAVARALVRAPRVIVADQPTAHQDAAGAQLVADLLAAAAAESAAVLVVSRDPHLLAIAARRRWRTVSIVARAMTGDIASNAPESTDDDDDATGRTPVAIAADDSFPIDIVVDDADGSGPAGAIRPKVLPFPVTHRSRRGVG